MNTRLFIQNKEIELDETVQFAITKQFEDLSNPTTIINDWSKTVSIPFTARNNEIFGHIYNIDRLIASDGTDKNTGIYFNPTLKMDFRLQAGDNVVMTGYAKMNEIKQKDGKGTYEITLFGQLGKLFQEMQKITFDTTTNDTDYLIHGEDYVDDYIDRTLVYNSWNSTGQTHSELLKKTDSGYTVTDIIGFAPNNAFSEEFDYKTFQTSSNSSTTWEDYLGDSFTQDTGIQPSTVIPNGLLPREVGEYRSYLQLPFIYWNKLFKIYQAKAEQLTGYQFDLDSEWFTTANPYWYNLVYMLKPLNFSNKSATTTPNRYKTTDDIYSWVPTKHTYSSGGKPPSIHFYYDWEGAETTNIAVAEKSETVPLYVSGNTFQVDESAMLSNDGSFNVRFSTTSDKEDLVLKFNTEEQAFVIDLKFTGINTGNVITKKIVFAGANPTDENIVNLKNSADSVCIVSESHANSYYDSNLGKYVYYIDCIAPLPNFPISAVGLDTEFNISYTAKWGGVVVSVHTVKLSPFIKYETTSTGWEGYAVHVATYDSDIVLNLNMSAKQDTFYSGSRFNLNNLWNKEFNLFNEIIKYCKIYRINITVDDLNKKIVFRRLPRYFRDYKVLDWTNKIDNSKDYIIKPITFENKYVLFNYKDSKTAIGEEYKKRYGVNYGDYRLVTDYNFNDSKTELFKDITQSIVSSDNVLSWITLARHKVEYTLGAEIFVNNRDKDKKQVDIFGSYFFHNGVAIFDVGKGSELAGVTISDDSDLQRENSTFFYSNIQSDRVHTISYPKLDIVRGDNMCLFNKPKENYTYLANYDNKKTIYDNFWYDYINERYNIQNKIITCYVMLTPTEYNQFQWNKFVKIGNQLCIVNKIYDYDMTSNQPTKVDLITIQDINGYTKNNYNA